ncbi:MAG: hypothetical protein Fur0011_1340 [Candidatus Microgenomates bacterium]
MVIYTYMYKLLLVLISSVILSGCTVQNLFVKKPAGLEVSTSAPATVYLSDKELGKTPLKNQNITPGKYTLRLIPDDTALTPYETTVELSSAASTVISRTFGETLLDSYGYSLSLIPDKTGLATLSVISDPDTGSLTIDGVPSGFTPLSKREISPGNHEVIVGTPGFAEQKISIVATTGFNLVVSVKLKSEPISLTPPSPSLASQPTGETTTNSDQSALTAAVSPTPSPRITPSTTPTIAPTRPYVTVSDSADVVSAGGLNVRKQPSSSAEILGKSDVGEHLKYLGETTSAGWHKIEFEGSVGYVSAKYTTLTK